MTIKLLTVAIRGVVSTLNAVQQKIPPLVTPLFFMYTVKSAANDNVNVNFISVFHRLHEAVNAQYTPYPSSRLSMSMSMKMSMSL